jgi:hypothetical protein
MKDQVHPRWGRPLDQYAISYDFDAARQRGTLNLDLEIEALKAVQKIGRLAGEAPNANQSNSANEVTLSTLKSLLRLSLDPRTLLHFADLSLISGCIKLLGMVKSSGKSSVSCPWYPSSIRIPYLTSLKPFRYEYGYLCFRIFVIALGVCLLKRSDNLDATTTKMITDSNAKVLVELSGRVSRVIQDVMEETIGGDLGDCDWILGWFKSPHHPQQIPLASRSDASLLLSLLWEDRTLFLKTFMSTYSPGLSGVIFLLWRYLSYERYALSSGTC